MSIKISKATADDIIQWMRAQMYIEWYSADTMKDEEAYYQLYFSNALNIIEELQDKLNGDE